MKVVRTAAQLRAGLAPARREARSIGLVATMGALHDGHLSLIRRAREQCQIVVVSLFVNPVQFNDDEDLRGYPRDEQRDCAVAERAGADYLFAPSVAEMYPPGFSTAVSLTGVADGLESVHRGPGHSTGVTTVVAKLLNIVGPDVAYFGRKDAQQVAVVRQMVRDLNLPVRIEACPTRRADDGLALSSRNARLSVPERRRATALHRALRAVQDAVRDGERDPAAARAAGLGELAQAGVALEYLELVSPETMAPVASIDDDVLAVIAGRVGTTRLIDNTLIHALRTAETAGSPT